MLGYHHVSPCETRAQIGARPAGPSNYLCPFADMQKLFFDFRVSADRGRSLVSLVSLRLCCWNATALTSAISSSARLSSRRNTNRSDYLYPLADAQKLLFNFWASADRSRSLLALVSFCLCWSETLLTLAISSSARLPSRSSANRSGGATTSMPS